jgi:hypothetical protein
MFYTPTKDMFTRSAVDTKKQTGKKTTLSNIEMFWFAYCVNVLKRNIFNF